MKFILIVSVNLYRGDERVTITPNQKPINLTWICASAQIINNRNVPMVKIDSNCQLNPTDSKFEIRVPVLQSRNRLVIAITVSGFTDLGWQPTLVPIVNSLISLVNYKPSPEMRLFLK